MTTFGDKNGGNWDLGPNSTDVRPDIYVALRSGTSSNAPFYTDDAMGGFAFVPLNLYGNDAAAGFYKVWSRVICVYERSCRSWTADHREPGGQVDTGRTNQDSLTRGLTVESTAL